MINNNESYNFILIYCIKYNDIKVTHSTKGTSLVTIIHVAEIFQNYCRNCNADQNYIIFSAIFDFGISVSAIISANFGHMYSLKLTDIFGVYLKSNHIPININTIPNYYSLITISCNCYHSILNTLNIFLLIVYHILDISSYL